MGGGLADARLPIQGHKVRCYPFMKQGEAEFSCGNCLHYEVISSLVSHLEIESVHQHESVNRCEGHPLIAVQKGVIVDQRLKQRGRLFAQVVVVTSLRPENSGLQCAMIEHPGLAAVFLDLVMMDGDDFSHRQVNALGHYLASRLYNSRYLSLDRR